MPHPFASDVLPLTVGELALIINKWFIDPSAHRDKTWGPGGIKRMWEIDGKTFVQFERVPGWNHEQRVFEAKHVRMFVIPPCPSPPPAGYNQENFIIREITSAVLNADGSPSEFSARVVGLPASRVEWFPVEDAIARAPFAVLAFEESDPDMYEPVSASDDDTDTEDDQ